MIVTVTKYEYGSVETCAYWVTEASVDDLF